MSGVFRGLLITAALIALAASGFFLLTGAGRSDPPEPDPAGARLLLFDPEPVTAAQGDLESVALLIEDLPDGSAGDAVPAALSEFLVREADRPRLSVLRREVTVRQELAGRALVELKVGGLGVYGRLVTAEAERACASREPGCFAPAARLLQLGRHMEAAGGAMVVHLVGVRLQSMVYASAGRVLDRGQLDGASTNLLRSELRVERHRDADLLRSLQSDHVLARELMISLVNGGGPVGDDRTAEKVTGWVHGWYSHLTPLVGTCAPDSTVRFARVQQKFGVDPQPGKVTPGRGQRSQFGAAALVTAFSHDPTTRVCSARGELLRLQERL